MAVDDIYQAVFSFNHPNGDGALSFSQHYRLDVINATRTEAQYALDLGTELVLECNALYMPHLSSDIEFVQVDVLNVTQPQYGNIQLSGVTGGLVEQCVSIRAAPVISKRSVLRGRSRRGRMFLMAPTEAQQSGGELNGAAKTLIQTFVNALLIVTPATSNIYQAVIWSKVLLEATDQVQNLVRDTVGSIRGRQKVS